MAWVFLCLAKLHYLCGVSFNARRYEKVDRFIGFGVGGGSHGSAEGEVIVLSRVALDPDAVERIVADDGQEAVEVARYNLQGVPVDKNEKGIQIVVYSNYTTKTVIVE